MTPLSTFLGAKEPQISVSGEQSTLSNFKPTTGQVMRASVDDVFSGEGSLSQDFKAFDIKEEQENNQPITQEDWTNSDNYRDGLTWNENITQGSASMLAEIEDDRQERALVLNAATGLQKTAGFGVSLAAGIFEPKNLVSGVVAAIATGGLGAVIPSLGRAIATTTIKGATARGGVEGIVAAGVVEGSNRESSKIVQGDYTMVDTMLNFGLSTVLGAGIGGGVKAFQLRKASKGYQPPSEGIAIKEHDTALAQLTQGQSIDVTAVQQVETGQLAAKATRALPEATNKLNTLVQEKGLTPVTELPEFKAWFDNSKVVDSDGKPLILYHGTTKDFDAFNKKYIGTSTDNGMLGKGFYFSLNNKTAESYGNSVVPVYLTIKNPLLIDNFKTKEDVASHLGIDVSTLTVGGTGIKSLQPFTGIFSTAVKNLGYDGVITKFEMVAFEPTQIKSIFNRGAFDPTDPRLIDIKKAEKLQVKKGALENQASKAVNEVPINKLANDTKANLSSAYDEITPTKVQQSIDSIGITDERLASDQLEYLQEQMQELADQGQLTSADELSLNKLAGIDNELDVWDNIYSNMKNCLTR